jgi:hypothetical protein
MKKNNPKKILLLLQLLLISSYLTAQTIYYVDASKPNNSGIGLSWANAKRNLQDAIDIATAGDQIWVKAGIYHPDEGTGLTNDDRNSYFNLKTDVKIYGSFVGTETSLTQRINNINSLTSILSGEIQQDANATNNAYHVINAIDLSANTILDGFKIRLGYADEGSNFRNSGGGIYIDAQTQVSNSLKVFNCVFQNNYSAHQGGAVNMIASSGKTINCTFKNTHFYDNSAGFDGGGVFASAIMGSNLSSFEDCIFNGNRANSGGAMHIYANSNGIASLSIMSVVFEDNFANSDAGALSNYVASGSSNTKILLGTFTNNYSGGNGGAIFSIAQQGSNNLEIKNTLFNGNKTVTTHSGGAVYILSDHALFMNNTIINKCHFDANEAGYGGGVAYASLKGIITSYIYQSLFTKNKADNGAAVDSYVELGTTNENLINCTITENIANVGTAVETYEYSTGVSNLLAVNSIIWGNTNAPGYGDVYLDTNTDTLHNCLIGNSSCSAAGQGNCVNNIFNENPIFENPTGNNYTLQATSPAINTGMVNASTAGLGTTDLGSQPRIIQTMDIGAYEFGCPIITWLGGTSSNWGTASNWNTNTVPTNITVVIIGSDTTFQPKVTGIYDCKTVIAKTGASVTVMSGSTLNVSGQ